VGSSNFAGWHIVQANEAARRRNFLGLVSEQSKYSLNARMVELEVLPACLAYGVGVIPWSPLGGGLLGGAQAASGDRSRGRLEQASPAVRASLEQYEALCTELDETPANVALAWLIHNPAVTAPIIGPRTLEQFEGSLRAVEIALSAEVLAKLDAIWPGPGGAAPEAYAW
jgi:aryl-alcohol dehydrogenase-like predicted oxidoreductase